VGKNTQNKTILTREFSSGGVVYKKLKTLWGIRKTSPSELYPNSYWMLAKGRIDDVDGDLPGPMASGKIKADEKSLQKAALREVEEEMGIEVKIIKKIETIMYSFTDPVRGKILKFVTFYLMEYIKDKPEGFDWETSEVAWLPFEKAYKTLSFGGEKSVLKKAKELL
jgi:8-oxo-dGTP pyrophosphatase MutT (NUDIX family)